MQTTKFTGKNQLKKRLAAQVGSKALAENLLKKRGDMKADGTLTAKGKKRDNMTAEERAKDRASRATGKPAKDFTYSKKTNRATQHGS